MARSSRPVFLNPFQIQMPVGAITSIGHRVSGVILAAGVPLGVYLLAQSLRDEQGFERVLALLGHWPVKGGATIVTWALAHHIFAGIRHLLSDFNVGAPLRLARRSAYLANIGGIAVALAMAVLLW